jgi:hypothetical protein
MNILNIATSPRKEKSASTAIVNTFPFIGMRQWACSRT